MKRLGIALALTTLLAGSALAADQTVQLKLSHWVPAAHPLHPAFQAWATDIEKESGGTIKSTLFPAQQLGKAVDHYDMVRDGIAGSEALDAWYRYYAAKEMKDVHFCFAFVHDPGGLHSRSKKIVLPSDISGLKVRPADATIGQLVSLLGGTNVQASAPEARDVLERGVADAITFPWNSTVLFGIDKATKYHMDSALYVTTFVWVLNQAKYDAMSPAQKKVIDDHCNTAWAEKIAAPWAEWEMAGRAKIKEESGHEVYQLTAEQLAAWRKAAAPLTAQWAEGAKRAGVDPDKTLAALKADLAQYQSAY